MLRTQQPDNLNKNINLINSEPGSTLYVFPNAKSREKINEINRINKALENAGNKNLPVPVNASKVAVYQPPQKPGVHNNNNTDNKNNDNIKHSGQTAKKQSVVKRLANRYRRGGLGSIDAYFNAYYFYFQFKKDNLRGKNGEEYGRYLAVLDFIAKMLGFFASVFIPMLNIFKRVKVFFTDFSEPAKAARNIRFILAKVFSVAAPFAAALIAYTVIINISSYTPALELTFDGRNLGFIDSRETVGKVVARIEDNVSAILDTSYEFPGRLEYRIVLTREYSYLPESELYNILYYSSQTQGAVTRAYGLYIDGILIAASEEETEIRTILREVLEENTIKEDNEIVEYAHEIQIILNNYASRDIVTREELKNIISFSAHDAVNDTNNLLFEYIFDNHDGENADENPNGSGEPGESKESVITESSGATIILDGGELYDPNAPPVGGVDEAAMAAASLLNLTSEETSGTIPRGFLGSSDSNSSSNSGSNSDNDGIFARMTRTSSNILPNSIIFKKIRTEVYTIETPYEIRYVNTDQYFAGSQTVQTNGSNGESVITADITYIAGEEVSREIIKEEILKEPVTRVVLRGTKPRPTTAPTGNFIRPLAGRVTSRFSTGHRALDIPAPRGTSVVAADGGTVIYAGNSGSYGNHVKIRHSNGFVTLYAHFSSISVKYGDSVYQGQEVGKVGSTGRSTGNHLHFEIIRNGVQVNPELYLP